MSFHKLGKSISIYAIIHLIGVVISFGSLLLFPRLWESGSMFLFSLFSFGNALLGLAVMLSANITLYMGLNQLEENRNKFIQNLKTMIIIISILLDFFSAGALPSSVPSSSNFRIR